MTQYATLDEALTDIAGRSFYETASATPNEDDTFTVDDYHTGGMDDCLMWTYDEGIEAPYGAIDYSRLMESSEFFETAGHIRFNLDEAVSALESGKRVAFQYVILDAYCEDEDCGSLSDDDACDGDHTAGWALVAYYA